MRKVIIEFTTEIKNNNFAGLCIEQNCGQEYQETALMNLSKGKESLTLLIPLCTKHSKIFNEYTQKYTEDEEATIEEFLASIKACREKRLNCEHKKLIEMQEKKSKLESELYWLNLEINDLKYIYKNDSKYENENKKD